VRLGAATSGVPASSHYIDNSIHVHPATDRETVDAIHGVQNSASAAPRPSPRRCPMHPAG